MKKNNDKHQLSPRLLAVKIIEGTLSGIKVQEAFNYYVERYHLSIQDRQFCADLVYGYLRTSIKLDFILDRFLKRSKKLPLSMRLILALGIYSLLFQEKIPAYAAINETVKEIKKNFGQALANVANGVLRNIQKLEQKPYTLNWYRKETDDVLKGDALFYSLPEPVVKLWNDSYGNEDALKLMERSSKRPWQGLRINALHPKAGELKKVLSEIDAGQCLGKYAYAFPPGKYIEKIYDKTLTDWINEGALSLQAPGSMLIMEELKLTSLEGPVWDCCAGSGIKSASLLERGVDISLASDLSRPRLENIKPFCKRLGLNVPQIIQASASTPPLDSWNGHIIADVPCSGLGVLARRPDIRIGIKQDEFWKDYVRVQKEIMRSLVSLLQVDKKLVYITCTLNPYENELLIREILQEYPDLKLEKEWQSPHNHAWLEGMYGAVLVKSSLKAL